MKKTSNKKNKIIASLEIFITITIVLVLIQTFLEDLSVALSWNQDIIFIIKISAIFFDLFFTIEFLVRLILATHAKKVSDYFFKEKGWIDFIASVPLLLLVSGPYFIGVITGTTIIGIISTIAGTGRALKVIKAIRVTRILRFIRMLKIFGKIKNVHSVMTKRHIDRLCTTTVFALTLFFIFVSLFQSIGIFPDSSTLSITKENYIKTQINKISNFSTQQEKEVHLKTIVKEAPEILTLIWNDKEIINNLNRNTPHLSKIAITPELIEKINLRETDLLVKVNPQKNLTLIFTRRNELKQNAMSGIISFILILFMISIILFFYAPHFAKTVTDPIFVMQKGFEKRDYTLAVKIPKKYKEDDIFQLSKNYNERWLPAKMRKLNSSKKIVRSKLSMEDILKMD